mmetsp:Transcript_71877/g.203607  ORF Transcript_71877/g.203607 Transcript_71877/m.203607 type:complete len:248 (-) Transcript_71877:1050-1793(-)
MRSCDQVSVIVNEVPVGVQLGAVPLCHVVVGPCVVLRPEMVIDGRSDGVRERAEVRGTGRVAHRVLCLGELAEEADEHGVGIRCVIPPKEDIDHQRAGHEGEVEIVVNEVVEEVRGVAEGRHVSVEPLEVAAGLGVVEAAQHPEHVRASLDLAAEGLVGRRRALEVVRQLAGRQQERAAAFQDLAHFGLYVWLVRVEHGARRDEIVRIEVVVGPAVAVVGPGDGGSDLAHRLPIGYGVHVRVEAPDR